MKLSKVVCGALVAGGLVFAVKSSGCLSSSAPDEKLGSHLDEMCDIVRANVEKPTKGLRKLGDFFAAHAGDMSAELVDTIALIEQIPDDEAHDARAHVARDRIYAHQCPKELDRFADAVENDPEALEMLEHFADRLERTLNIIFQGQPGHRFNLRDLQSRFRL